MKTLKLVAAITALTGSMSVNAANIDLFTDPAGTTRVSLAADVTAATTTITDSAGGVTVSGTALTGTVADLTPSSDFKETGAGAASILGGYRDMEVNLLSLETNTSTSGGADLKVSQTLAGAGRLTFSSDDGVVAKGTVQWDGADASKTLDTSGFDLDISDGGAADRFIFDVISADLDFSFSLALHDADGSSVIFDLPATTGPHTSTIMFSAINNAFGALTTGCTLTGSVPGLINSATCVNGTTAGIDFEHVSAMELILNTGGVAGATASLDMTIGGIQTVPEPSSVALIGLGLLASGFAGKRKSKKA